MININPFSIKIKTLLEIPLKIMLFGNFLNENVFLFFRFVRKVPIKYVLTGFFKMIYYYFNEFVKKLQRPDISSFLQTDHWFQLAVTSNYYIFV